MIYFNYVLIFVAAALFFLLVILMTMKYLQEKLEFSKSRCYEELRRFIAPEKLLSLIDGERADSALYAHLAARMKGRAQAMLRAIAQQEACHAKKLAAVYFLNTGKKACPGRPERPCVTCINETLRQQYTAEHAAHEAYAALAENAGTHRCMLLRMAQEECEHAQLILCILQNCL